MKIFAVENTMKHFKADAAGGIKNFLISYWYDTKGKAISELRKEFPEGEIFLDSGAYTAFVRKKSIKLEDYIDYITKFGENATLIASLDVIRNAEATLENWEKIRSSGLKSIIPTYHVGSPYSFLDYYVQKSDFIAIGGLVPLSPYPRKLTNYLTNVFERIPKKKKVHLFGLTNSNVLFRFADRMYSCDSSIIAASNRNNKAISVTGMPRNTGGIPGRINPDLYYKKIEYMGFRIAKLEREINEYIERKKQLVAN